MVTVKAPKILDLESKKGTVAVDLVAVLDISGSMSGAKIDLLKDAVRFVVRELTERDRLSLIVFNSAATKLTPLTVMTGAGKEKLCAIVDGIAAGGGTMIGHGLEYALKTLQGRRHPNNVPSILLLSDGQDGAPAGVRAMEIPYVVHTFGFGKDHDAGLLSDVAEKTHGTFCFVEHFDVMALFLFLPPARCAPVLNILYYFFSTGDFQCLCDLRRRAGEPFCSEDPGDSSHERTLSLQAVAYPLCRDRCSGPQDRHSHHP